MTPGLPFLAAAGIGYLLLLFLLATAVDRGLVPPRLARHPLVPALALGVYASSWSFYGSVGFAQRQGYLFLTIYLGVTLACLLIPVLWMPILRLAREYQLTSLADLFAFRYRTPWVGAAVTVFLLAGTLPYLALQIRAVTESMGVLGFGRSPVLTSAAFCVTITLFTILFGAHISPRERHEGLVFAIAFESVVKLVALLAVGACAVFGVFGGLSGIGAWLHAHPEALSSLYRPARDGPWGTLLLLTFSAAFLLPRQFHVAFAETADERSLRTATWAFPLFLLLLNVAIPPILWAGTQLAPHGDADFYVLDVARTKAPVALLAFIGGLSAASAMLIVTALALSSMCLNHLVLPLRRPRVERDLYRWILWARRALIVTILASGFVFFLLLQRRRGLAELGLVSFVATAQFLPGLFGVLFWPRATRAGLLSGLCAGAAVWAATVLFPLLARSEIFPSPNELSSLLGSARLDSWTFATFLSLGLNALLFGAVSFLGKPRAEDEAAASACRRDVIAPAPAAVTAGSPAEFQQLLAPLLGPDVAEAEVRHALADLQMDGEDRRAAELLRLRARIEANLSGLMGPMLARVVVDAALRIDPRGRTPLATHLRSLEDQLRAMPLRGPAAQLEQARRYFRRILHDLPLGVCVLGPDEDVTVWNRALSQATGIDEPAAVGLRAPSLPAPWGKALATFARARQKRQEEIWLGGRCYELHKSRLDEEDTTGGVVLLVADLTDQKRLQAQLAHQDRLASVGRLAAGVAHEIGNPLTGIASVAQNLRSDTDPSSVGERVDLILQQTRRIEAIVRSLLRFSHAGDEVTPPAIVQHALFDVREAIDDAVRLVHLSRSGRRVLFENECPWGLWVAGDRQQLAQVFVNLLANASDASKPGARVVVRGAVGEQGARIDVVDQGGGIPEEIRGRIFEPFFTTKAPGEGTGLGLSVVWSIVHEHRGRIEVESALGLGTTVSVHLPGTMRSVAEGRFG